MHGSIWCNCLHIPDRGSSPITKKKKCYFNAKNYLPTLPFRLGLKQFTVWGGCSCCFWPWTQHPIALFHQGSFFVPVFSNFIHAKKEYYILNFIRLLYFKGVHLHHGGTNLKPLFETILFHCVTHSLRECKPATERRHFSVRVSQVTGNCIVDKRRCKCEL